jgi:hypothetical protein
MFKLIEANQLPETKYFRGRPVSKLREIEEFQKALDCVRNNLVAKGKAVEITLSEETLAEYKDVKNLENRLMQLLTTEFKKEHQPFTVRKRTVNKGERPHLYLVHNQEPQPSNEFESALKNASSHSKSKSAAA